MLYCSSQKSSGEQPIISASCCILTLLGLHCPFSHRMMLRLVVFILSASSLCVIFKAFLWSFSLASMPAPPFVYKKIVPGSFPRSMSLKNRYLMAKITLSISFLEIIFLHSIQQHQTVFHAYVCLHAVLINRPILSCARFADGKRRKTACWWTRRNGIM